MSGPPPPPPQELVERYARIMRHVEEMRKLGVPEQALAPLIAYAKPVR